MGCGAETEANNILTALTQGENFTLPTLNLDSAVYAVPDPGVLDDAIVKLTNDDLTTGSISGTGTLDRLLAGVKAQLREEFDSGRITGDQYAKAHVELTAAAMGNAVQFLLGKDQAYWQAALTQAQALVARVELATARVKLETAKAELISKRFEASNMKATYALTKMKLSTESIAYCQANYTLTELMPLQKNLLKEQTEVQRAQTMETRSDGPAVTGLIGQQKALYKQQITSYKRDAEVKAVKLFTDAWITNKTIDEGLLAPNNFTNNNIDQVLSTLRNNLQLDGGSHP